MEQKERNMKKLASNHGKYMKAKPPYLRLTLSLIVGLALTVVVLLNLFTHVFSVVQYYGDGMEPGLQDRQILVVLQTDQVKQGDVAAFYYNNKVLVRRIIAGGGASVEMDDRGKVKVDGAGLDEPYVQEHSPGQCNISFPYTVPYDEFFVMGDNRAIAMDSRLEEIGTIPRNRILGKVIWSFG